MKAKKIAFETASNSHTLDEVFATVATLPNAYHVVASADEAELFVANSLTGIASEKHTVIVNPFEHDSKDLLTYVDANSVELVDLHTLFASMVAVEINDRKIDLATGLLEIWIHTAAELNQAQRLALSASVTGELSLPGVSDYARTESASGDLLARFSGQLHVSVLNARGPYGNSSLKIRHTTPTAQATFFAEFGAHVAATEIRIATAEGVYEARPSYDRISGALWKSDDLRAGISARISKALQTSIG